MRRVIVIAAAGFSLAGCSSFSMGDYFKSTPPTVQVQLDSQPQGADARTSLGPGCKTPCAVTITPPESSFSVSYSLNKYVPATVPVQVNRDAGTFTTPATTTIDPNPVFAQLQPAGPPPKPQRKHVRPRKPKPPADAAAPADAAFPEPAQAPQAGAAPPPPGRK